MGVRLSRPHRLRVHVVTPFGYDVSRPPTRRVVAMNPRIGFLIGCVSIALTSPAVSAPAVGPRSELCNKLQKSVAEVTGKALTKVKSLDVKGNPLRMHVLARGGPAVEKDRQRTLSVVWGSVLDGAMPFSSRRRNRVALMAFFVSGCSGSQGGGSTNHPDGGAESRRDRVRRRRCRRDRQSCIC